MKCKFEHDEDCCNSGATQYMCKCKKPCATIVPITNAEKMVRLLQENDAYSLLDWWEEIFEDGVPSEDYFEWWLQMPAEE